MDKKSIKKIMKKKRVEKIQRWLAELGPEGGAVGKMIGYMVEARESGESLGLEEVQGGLSVLSVFEVLDHLKELGPEASAMACMLRRLYEAPMKGNVISPLSSLGGLIVRRALDEDLPQSVVDAAGLSEEEKKIWAELQDVLGWLEAGCQGINRPKVPGGG